MLQCNLEVSLQFIAYPETAAGCANLQYAARSQQISQWDPAMSLLGHRLQEYLLDKSLSYNRRQYNRTDLQPLPTDRIRVYKSAVLAADCPWEPEDLLLQTVKANNSFHGAPFFDCVAVRVATTPPSSRVQRTAVEYARLLLLFSIQLPDEQGKRTWQQFAYVKWFKTVAASSTGQSATDPIVKAGGMLLA